MSVSIQDVADACGVSRSTVDRVLYHRGRVSEATKSKVLLTVKELGYKPNPIGQALAQKSKKYTIGVILCSVENAFYDDIIQGINDSLVKDNIYNVDVIINSMKGYCVETQLKLIDDIAPKVDCLLINAIDDQKIIDRINMLAVQNLPVFTLNTDVSKSKRLAHIGVDVIQCGKIACGLVAKLCNETANVLITTGSLTVLEHKQRIEGFKEQMSMYYPDISIRKIIETQDSNEIAFQIVQEYLNHDQDIQAVFIAAAGAKGVCKAMHETKLTSARVIACDMVPEVIQQMKLGMIDVAIDQQPWEQGYYAVKLAIKYLTTGELDFPQKIRNEIKILESI